MAAIGHPPSEHTRQQQQLLPSQASTRRQQQQQLRPREGAPTGRRRSTSGKLGSKRWILQLLHSPSPPSSVLQLASSPVLRRRPYSCPPLVLLHPLACRCRSALAAAGSLYEALQVGCAMAKRLHPDTSRSSLVVGPPLHRWRASSPRWRPAAGGRRLRASPTDGTSSKTTTTLLAYSPRRRPSLRRAPPPLSPASVAPRSSAPLLAPRSFGEQKGVRRCEMTAWPSLACGKRPSLAFPAGLA